MSEIHDHPFIQEVIQIKEKSPSFKLYMEDNLHEIEQFCLLLNEIQVFSESAKLLILVHVMLIRKGKDNVPIFLAAIYLHWDGLYSTYHQFLSHLQANFTKKIGGT